MVSDNRRQSDEVTTSSVGLRTEYEEEPTNLPAGDVHLRFSWRLEPDRRGAQQQAYRILVATVPAPLETDEEALWDSGKVDSTQSTGVPYDGPELAAETRYSWTVRIGTKTVGRAIGVITRRSEPPSPSRAVEPLTLSGKETGSCIRVMAQIRRVHSSGQKSVSSHRLNGRQRTLLRWGTANCI